jgi:hypothetical protein
MDDGTLSVFQDLGVTKCHTYIIYSGEEKLVDEAESLECTLLNPGTCYSTDGKIRYSFSVMGNVTIANTETQVIENEIHNNTIMIPCGFDDFGRLWIMRSESTIEAWDIMLTKTLSRHKLKGRIIGTHKNAHGNMCVVTESEKAGIVYVYRLG